MNVWDLNSARNTLVRCGVPVPDELEAAIANHEALAAWLDAENDWGRSVRSWLAAESRWSSMQERLDSRAYVLARAGWEAMKQYVPNLDGEASFDSLAEALQFRYAVFASSVANVAPPEHEVRSQKQVLRDNARQQEDWHSAW